MPHLQTGALRQGGREEDKLAFEHDGEIEVAEPMLNVAATHVNEWVGLGHVV